MRSIELFAGAGGLAMGMSRAGFRHAAVVEWDHDACETFRQNQRLHAHDVEDWPVLESDVKDVAYGSIKPTGAEEISVISGGPPCQPFSMAGKARGHRDNRDMFPEAVRAVRELRPKAFIFENVRGLMRPAFSAYFEYIYLQLSYPDLKKKAKEGWVAHRSRLERHHTSHNRRSDYNVVFRVLNAADYGVPQKRERVFLVGFRSDLNASWAFPEPTHSEERLAFEQWVTGEYWDRHRIARKHRPPAPKGMVLPEHGLSTGAAWVTVRDAIADLPDPIRSPNNPVPNHTYVSGARSYKGHTGSPWDAPSKTLKAGDHGVPGGENTLLMEDGSVRYFTIRESARLQTFPDDFRFSGSWTEAMRQLGNAVPVRLAECVASSVAVTLQRLAGAKGIS